MTFRESLFQTTGILALCVGIGACSQAGKQASTDPTAVEASSVKSIVLPEADKLESCELSLERQGAKILYRSEAGALMLDKATQGLGLKNCGGIAEDNAEVSLPSLRAGEKPDLSTLLRLIPAEEIGARSFMQANPSFDGRGVVVAILDTGVELDHPMLTTTSDGKRKVVDFKDFSGEGDVALADAEVSAEGDITSGDLKYSSRTVVGLPTKLGVYGASSLKYSEDVAGVDTFVDVGVLAYKRADGEWVGRIDTNNDKSFDDEAELADFAKEGKFTKLGAKKTLTVSLAVNGDANRASVSFDDGSHGTHVAGIAAGYQEGGLVGAAPGAQVIGAKIGDNRLSGGSTTTASMMLAIDFAVKSKAHVINLSYGIRAGSNLGKSAIDLYVDKVARESGVIFSISAGNEGPGMLTIGTPAGADLAITNGAYVSAATARDNYGYVGMKDNTVWFFSSIGPRLDGGWKPSLLAPGSALSSVPSWAGAHGNYRGTSMASPQTTGGLALVLSAAIQSGVTTERAAVTRAVYDSAKHVAGLSLIEQGHGLFNVPAAFEALKKITSPVVEYDLGVNSPTSPTGRGKGIFVRAGVLPQNLFAVGVTPVLKRGQAPQDLALRTLTLESSAAWIETPGSLWIQGAPRSFQVKLNEAALGTPGLYSERLVARDDLTNAVVFEVPVTVIVPERVNAENQYRVAKTSNIRVGQTERRFIEIPQGTTAVSVELESDGPILWAQLLDGEGHKVLELRDVDGAMPLPRLSGAANVTKSGVYELDIVAPATNPRPAALRFTVKAHSLLVQSEPAQNEGEIAVTIQNGFTAQKFVPKAVYSYAVKKQALTINGNSKRVDVEFSEAEKTELDSVSFEVRTPRATYDLMTDYPFRLFGPTAELILSGGLELISEFSVAASDFPVGKSELEIQGAFTKAPPESWRVTVLEKRIVTEPKTLWQGVRFLAEAGQTLAFTVNLSELKATPREGFTACPELVLEASPNGLVLQKTALCNL